jgi:hypothetical protein
MSVLWGLGGGEGTAVLGLNSYDRTQHMAYGGRTHPSLSYTFLENTSYFLIIYIPELPKQNQMRTCPFMFPRGPTSEQSYPWTEGGILLLSSSRSKGREGSIQFLTIGVEARTSAGRRTLPLRGGQNSASNSNISPISFFPASTPPLQPVMRTFKTNQDSCKQWHTTAPMKHDGYSWGSVLVLRPHSSCWGEGGQRRTRPATI